MPTHNDVCNIDPKNNLNANLDLFMLTVYSELCFLIDAGPVTIEVSNQKHFESRLLTLNVEWYKLEILRSRGAKYKLKPADLWMI